MEQQQQQQHRRNKNFENSKNQCLGKRDKSSQGRIDPRAVEVCGLINQGFDCFYTTSSCAGRCFLYRGRGVKSSNFNSSSNRGGGYEHHVEDANGVSSAAQQLQEGELKDKEQAQPHFVRFRVSHQLIHDPCRYFDLSTIKSDPTGGGDPVRCIGQYDHKDRLEEHQATEQQTRDDAEEKPPTKQVLSGDTTVIHNGSGDQSKSTPLESTSLSDKSVWLRFEPFILHVACRSLKAASVLMATARPTFKNVGLTTWNSNNSGSDGARYIVAIWGDEGLDMPLCMPDGATSLLSSLSRTETAAAAQSDSVVNAAVAEWLALLVNERHERNWEKIDRFVDAVRNMSSSPDAEEGDDGDGADEKDDTAASSHIKIPRSYDTIGDIAVLHTLGTTTADITNREEHERLVGEALIKRNKAIRVVALRQSNLVGTERAPGDEGLRIIAGTQRRPLMTTHSEYNIKCVVDVAQTFFSPRMAQERLRICQQVARGEHVLVLFCGVAMDALQIAGRTEALSITAIEQNEIAVQCALRSRDLLKRNKSVKCVGAAERLEIAQGDVAAILPTLRREHYDRVLAPRPKEGVLDGDLGTGDAGIDFLRQILPILKPDGGECHWYDFASDQEYPQCQRTRELLERVCSEHGLEMEVLHVANAGSVAMRQLRVCVDFRIRKPSANKV